MVQMYGDVKIVILKIMEENAGNSQGNRAIQSCVKELLHRLLHQYRSQSYQINAILKDYYEKFLCKDSDPALLKVKAIWSDICLLVWELSCVSKTIIYMLHNEEIHADETQSIDMHIFSTRIFQQFFVILRARTQQADLFKSLAHEQIYFFIEEISGQVCQLFSVGQDIIQEEIRLATEQIKNSGIINFYILFVVMKDVSHECQRKIQAELCEGLFRNIENQIVVLFTNYILEKYELLSLHANTSENKISLTDRIANSNQVKWREAVRDDGQIAILVELEEDDSQQNYLLKYDEDNDEMMVMSCSSIRRKWMVCRKAQKNYDILNLIKNKKAFVERMRDSPSHVANFTIIDNLGILGGSMGRCLAQIDKYKTISHFMTDLSKRTIVGGSVTYMINTVPILGYIFITGGFTYSFYYIFSNKFSNKKKKLRDLGNMTIGTATSIGSGILGAAIGQTLIPIPVLGTFIGGFIGGFLGEFGGRKICGLIDSARLKQSIKLMEITIQPKGYWEINQKTLNILGIRKQKFYETIPAYLQQKMNCDRLWLTLIFFTLLSFNEAKKRMKFMEKKLSQLEKKIEKQKNLIQSMQMIT